MTTVEVGCQVVLRCEHGSSVLIFDIVNDECKTTGTAILASSKLAQALMGKKIGDRVILKASGGQARYYVSEIKPIHALA